MKDAGFAILTIASVDPSTDHKVISPFWILRTLRGENWKVRTDPPADEAENPALAAAGWDATCCSMPLEEEIGNTGIVRKVLRGFSTAGTLVNLLREGVMRCRAAFDSKNDDEADANI